MLVKSEAFRLVTCNAAQPILKQLCCDRTDIGTMLIFVCGIISYLITGLFKDAKPSPGATKIEVKREYTDFSVPTGLFLGVTEEFHEIFSQNVSATSRTGYL